MVKMADDTNSGEEDTSERRVTLHDDLDRWKNGLTRALRSSTRMSVRFFAPGETLSRSAAQVGI